MNLFTGAPILTPEKENNFVDGYIIRSSEELAYPERGYSGQMGQPLNGMTELPNMGLQKNQKFTSGREARFLQLV